MPPSKVSPIDEERAERFNKPVAPVKENEGDEPGTGAKVMNFIKGALWGREFMTYLAFVVIFSIVAFRSRPGIIQFYLNRLNTDNFGTDFDQIKSQLNVFDWVRNDFIPTAFPEFNYDGTPLQNYTRVYISGEGRVLGAHRLRQVRSKPKVCNVPSKLQTVLGVKPNCTTDYHEGSTRLQQEIINPRSPDYRALNYTANFTLPFTWLSAEQLNATDVDLEGYYAKYGASGYALDMIPNVDPNTFATLLDECYTAMIWSLVDCHANQGIAEPATLRDPPVPVPYSANNTCSKLRKVFWTAGLNVSSCQKREDRKYHCPLRYASFGMVLKYSDDAHCGQCKCVTSDMPEYAACVHSCSPRALALDQLDTLQQYGWMDTNTRAVILDTSLYYPNDNLFTVVRDLFELPAFAGSGEVGGDVFSAVFISTFKIFRYQTFADKIVLGFEIVLLGFIAFYTFEEIFEIRRQGWAYFSEGWNYVDWTNLGIFYAVIALRAISYQRLTTFQFDSQATRYLDFPAQAAFANSEINVNAINFFLMYFKFFKYLRAMPRMDAILVTISTAAFDLILFLVMAVIILTGFAAAFYTCFGEGVEEYSTLGDSYGALGRALLGDFDYAALKNTNSIMAPLLFYTFFSTVFFILLNMFLAIVNDSYMVVKSSQTEADLNFYRNMTKQFKTKLTHLFSRKQAISQFARDLETRADANSDDMVDLHELEKVLADNPQALELLKHKDAKEILKKYDVNRDGVLTKQEMTKLLVELYQREADVTAEIEQAKREGEAEAQRAAAPRGRAMGRASVSRLGSNRTLLGGGGGTLLEVAPALTVMQATVEARIDAVEMEMREMNRTMAKKMSLMIDLLMSLSDQVAQTAQASTAQPPALPATHPMVMLQPIARRDSLVSQQSLGGGGARQSLGTGPGYQPPGAGNGEGSARR